MAEEGKRREPKSEAVERPWASNDKITYDTLLQNLRNTQNHYDNLQSEVLAGIRQAREHADDQHTARMQQAQQCTYQLALLNNIATRRVFELEPEEAAAISKVLASTVPTEAIAGAIAIGLAAAIAEMQKQRAPQEKE